MKTIFSHFILLVLVPVISCASEISIPMQSLVTTKTQISNIVATACYGSTSIQTITPVYQTTTSKVYADVDLVDAMQNFTNFVYSGQLDELVYDVGSVFSGLARIISQQDTCDCRITIASSCDMSQPKTYTDIDLVDAMQNFTNFVCSGQLDIIAYNIGSIFAGLSHLISPQPTRGAQVNIVDGLSERTCTICVGYKVVTETTGGNTSQIVSPIYTTEIVVEPTLGQVDYCDALTNFYGIYIKWIDKSSQVDWMKVATKVLAINVSAVLKELTDRYDIYALKVVDECEDKEDTPSADFMGEKAAVFNGLVYDADGVVCGIVQVTTGKATKKGVKVGGFVMLEDGKKQTIKSSTVAIENGYVKVSTKVGKLGTAAITVGGDGFKGTLGNMTLASAATDENTGILSGTLKMSYFDAKTGKIKTKSIKIGGVTAGGEAVGSATINGQATKSFSAEVE